MGFGDIFMEYLSSERNFKHRNWAMEKGENCFNKNKRLSCIYVKYEQG